MCTIVENKCTPCFSNILKINAQLVFRFKTGAGNNMVARKGLS